MTTLGETGQILVTQAAADAYADARDLGFEEARRELTGLLLGARRRGDSRTGAESWRARSAGLGVDVGAMIARDGKLAIVTHVSVRPFVRRKGAGAAERRAERRRAERGEPEPGR